MPPVATDPSNKKFNFHTIYQSDDDDEDFEDDIKTGWKLYEAIFSYLDPESLLEARQVCRRWNDAIIQSSESLLWSKMCVRIEDNQNWPILPKKSTTKAERHPDQNKSQDCPSSSSPALGFSHMIHHSPNFHFIKCDFRLDCVHDFFLARGPFLKFIKITNCTLTLPILQVIVYTCERVEHFEINGLSRNLVIGESIFPKKFAFRRFPRLKTLVLKSPEESKSSSAVGNTNKVTSSLNGEESLPFDNNLTCGFIQDMIDYADNLEVVVLDGWSPKTGSDFMSILTHRGRYSKITEFHMKNIPPVIKSVHLIPFCVKTAHIQLKKLTISPANDRQFNDFGNIIIREIIKNYRETLEELNVTNCPVSSAIFRFPCPQLRVFIACGTMIKSPILFQNQTPKLQKFIYKANPASPKQVFERIKLLLRTKSITPQYIMDRLREKLGSVPLDNLHNQTFAEMMAYGCWNRPATNNNHDNNNDNNTNSTNANTNADDQIDSESAQIKFNLLQNITKGTKRKKKGEERKSVLEGLETCSWLDFSCLVFFASLIIFFLIWAISCLFNAYAPIVFVSIILVLIFCELYGERLLPFMGKLT